MVFAIAGALAWTAPFVYEVLKKPVIKGKILTFYKLTNGKINFFDVKSESTKEISGLIYILKLSLISLNNSFNIYKIDTRVKYDDEQWLQGEIYWTDTILISENKPNDPVLPNNVPKKQLLKFDPKNNIIFVNYLEKDKTYAVWVTVFVDKATNAQFKEIEFAFINYKRKMLKISFRMSDIDSKKLHGLSEIYVREILPEDGFKRIKEKK